MDLFKLSDVELSKLLADAKEESSRRTEVTTRPLSSHKNSVGFDVKGHELAKRVILVAAAGQHSLILFWRSRSRQDGPAAVGLAHRSYPEASSLLAHAVSELGISQTERESICRVAGTIAGLQGNDKIDSASIAEAVQHRRCVARL